MKVTFDIPASAATISAALEGLVATNYVILSRSRNPIKLYRSGVRYRPEARGVENWLTIPQVIKAGVGDCEDLAAWRAAELRFWLGLPARAICYRSGRRKFHAVVAYPDGTIEDPSRKLGMGTE
jgi:hypothetical protein